MSFTLLLLPMRFCRTFRSELRPMVQVDVKARDKKWVRGYQNQNCENTRIPMIASMLLCPVRDCSEIVSLRPPENYHKNWVKIAMTFITFILQPGNIE